MNRRNLIAFGGLVWVAFPRVGHSQIITPPESLKLEGYFAFPTLRTGYAPGTVLQRYEQSGIQKTRVFLELNDLELNPPVVLVRIEEEIPASTYSTSSSIGGAIDFLLAASGLRPKVEANYSSGSTLAIKYGRGYRESIKGADVRRVIQAALKRGLPLPGQYSLVTSTISFRKIEARLSSRMGMALQADLTAATAKADGGVKIVSDQLGTLVPREFSSPMRAFYSWDEIRPTSGAAVGPGDASFDLVPGQVELPIEPVLISTQP